LYSDSYNDSGRRKQRYYLQLTLSCNHISTLEETVRERPLWLSPAALDVAWPSDTTTTASSRSETVRLLPLNVHPTHTRKRDSDDSVKQLQDMACSALADCIHGRRHQAAIGPLQALKLRWLAVRIGQAAAAGVSDIGPGRCSVVQTRKHTSLDQHRHALMSGGRAQRTQTPGATGQSAARRPTS